MNKRIDLQKNLANQKQRFSIRKLSIGAASVLLGTTFLFGAGSVVHADTISEPANQQKETFQEKQSSDATNNQTSASINQAVKQQQENATGQKDDQGKVESSQLSSTNKSINTQSNVDKPVEKNNTLNVQNAKQTPVTADEVKASKAKTEDQQEVTAHLILFDGKSDPNLKHPIKVELHAHVGETLRDAINRQAKEDLIKQESYFGPTGDDYVIDETTNKKVGVSPIVACQTTDANITHHIYSAEVDQAYEQWEAYKSAHFPLAGYTVDNDSSNLPELDESIKDGMVFNDDGDELILLTHNYSKYGYKNCWEKLKRTVKFKKYYSKSDLASDAAKESADDIIDPNTNSTAVTHAGKAILDTTAPQSPMMTIYGNINSVPTTIDNINSTTSTMYEHPVTDDANNEVEYMYFAHRYYDPAIGNISEGSTGNAGSNSVDIQFPAVKVSRDINEKDGNWTTFDNDVPVSSNTDCGQDTEKGRDTYWFNNNGDFKLVSKDISNPAPRYVFYYHDQPVDVTFEDVSGGKEVKLSTYNASKLLDIRENSKTDPNEAKYTAIQIRQHKNKNPYFKQYSYQADDNKYQNVFLNTPNKYAKKAATALKGATNFKEVLAAYQEAGYELVSADADDLAYDKDKVWDRNKHVITQYRVVKLVIAAKKVDANTKTVTRTVNFKSSDGTVLRDPITETVTYKQPAYYVDSFGNCVSVKPNVANSNVFEITGTASKPKLELTSKTANFYEVDEPEITNGKLSGDWIRIDATKDSKQGPALDGQVVPAESIDPSVADKTAEDYTIVYAQKAVQKTTQKQATRTIHYVKDENKGLSVDKMPELQKTTEQKVELKGTYYTDADGHYVSTKTVKVANGKEVVVVDKQADAPIYTSWKLNENNSTKDVTGKGESYDFAAVNDPTSIGNWKHQAAEDKDNGKVTVDPNNKNWQDKLADAYLVYKDPVAYNVHYIDVTGSKKTSNFASTDGKEINGKEISNINGTVGETPDKTKSLWNYAKDGYILVQNTNGNKLAHTELTENMGDAKDTTGDQYIYLIHDVESKIEAVTQPRTIKYFDAETGKEVAKEVTQNVAWKRTKVIDKVTRDVLGYNTSGKKDQYGRLTIDTTDPDKAWIVTSTDKKYAPVVSPDLTSKGYKKTPSFDQKKDKEDAAIVADKAAIPTEKGGEVDVYYFHDTREKDVKKSETRTIHYVSEDGKTLQSPTVQTVTLNGKQTIDKVTGKQIGNTIWTVKTPSDKDGITVNKDDKASFKQVQKDVINKGNNTWTIQKANDQYSEPDKYNKVAPNDKVSSDFKDGHNSDIYLVYSVDRNADITYWDITDGKNKKEQLGKTEKDLDKHGKTGQTITLPKDKTADFKKKGYKLVSTDYKPGDKYGKQDSHFNVYLEHDTETVTDSKTVKETIHYIYKDSGKPAAKDKTAKVTFTRTGKKDKVTGKITWNNWTPKQSFSQVKSPEITNYKPDQTEVNKKTVSHNSKDIEVTVNYTKTSTTPQLTKTVEHRHVKRTISYVDTSNNQVDGSPNHTNSFDQDVDFTMNKYMLGGQLFGYGFGNFGVSLFAVYGGNGNFLGLSSTKGSKTPDKKAPDESWNDYAWSKAKPKSFSQVESGNKTKLGYQSVDKTQVGMQEVKATDKDSQALVVYDKSNKHKLVIHYQDENGHQLIPNKNNGDNYKTGDSFNSSSNSKLMPPKIKKDGKTYILVPHRSYNPKGNFGNGDEFTIFVYREVGKPETKEHKLTINYVDENGNSISSSENGGENFKKGDSYTEASQSHMKKEITTKDGKTFILVPNKTANDHGEFGDGDEVTTYVYKLVSQKTSNTKPSDNNKPVDNNKPTKPNEDIPTYPDHPSDNHQLIIHYVDENGKELAKPVVDPGYSSGDNFNSDSRRPTEIVKGNETYVLVPEKTKNSHGTFGNHDESTVYVYVKKMINPDIASSKDPAKQTYYVTIQYVDQNGNKIAPDVHDPHEYHQGDHYDSNKYAKNEIHKDGKTYKMTGSKNTSGTISDHDETTTYYYETVRPIALGSKKDRKKSAQQKRAAKNTTRKNSVKQTISRKASVRKTASRNSSYRNSTAALSEDQMNNKNYNYATATLAEEDNAEAKQVESVNTHADKSAKTLPQTGEEKSNASVFGLALASIAGFFGLAGTSRKKRN